MASQSWVSSKCLNCYIFFSAQKYSQDTIYLGRDLENGEKVIITCPVMYLQTKLTMLQR
jgi:hypothetical protein